MRAKVLRQGGNQAHHQPRAVRSNHGVGDGLLQKQPLRLSPLDVLQKHHDAPVPLLWRPTITFPLQPPPQGLHRPQEGGLQHRSGCIHRQTAQERRSGQDSFFQRGAGRVH